MDINDIDYLAYQNFISTLGARIAPPRYIVKDFINSNLQYIGYSQERSPDETSSKFLIRKVFKSGSISREQWSPLSEDKNPFITAWSQRTNPATFPAITPSYATNRSLFFDGVNDYLVSADNPLLDFPQASAFSLGIWVKSTVPGISGTIMNKLSGTTSGYQLTHDTSGRIQFRFVGNPAGREIIIREDITTLGAVGAWHLIGVSYDGSQDAAGMRLYVDGLELGRNVLQNNLSGSTQNAASLYIGADDAGAAPRFFGFMTEPHIWQGGFLTQAEWQEVYANKSQQDLSVAGSIYNNQGFLSVRFRAQDTVYPNVPDDQNGLTAVMTNMTLGNIVAEIHV